jgi:hypothetical protein
LESKTLWSLVAAGSLLALGAAALPWLVPRLVLSGLGAWLAGSALGLPRVTALFSACGYSGSAALLELGPRGDPASYTSLAEIGTGIATVGLVLAWRSNRLSASGPRWAGGLGVLLALAACYWSACHAGFESDSARWLPALVPTSVALFALAGFCSEAGVLRGRAVLQFLTLAATVCALRLPDLCAACSIPAALGLALCAGDALESAPRASRALGGAAFVLLAALALWVNAPEPIIRPSERQDAQVEWVRWRPSLVPNGLLSWEVEVDARVPVTDIVLVLASAGESGRRLEYPMRREAIEGGARFTHAPIARAHLRECSWTAKLELIGAQGTQIGERVIGTLLLPQAPGLSLAFSCFLLAGLCLLCMRGSSVRSAWAGTLLAATQAAWLYART